MLCESPKNGGKADFAERTNRPRMREVESRPQHNTKRRRKVSGCSTGAKTDTTPKIDAGIRSSESSRDLAKNDREWPTGTS